MASPSHGPPTPLHSRRSARLPLLQRHQQPPIGDNSTSMPAPLHTTTRPHSLHEPAPAMTGLPSLRSGLHLQQSRNTNDDEPATRHPQIQLLSGLISLNSNCIIRKGKSRRVAGIFN
ncbi:hypothetical protein P3S67_006515 [Capsicum chacoense]